MLPELFLLCQSTDILEWETYDFSATKDSCLVEAAKNGNLVGVKYLLAAGADNAGQALSWAAAGLHLEVVKYLVSEAKLTTRSLNPILVTAAAKGDLEIVKYLHEAGGDIRFCDDEALIWAAFNGNLEIVKYLITNGADVNNPRRDGALGLAAMDGHLRVVKYLVEAGASRLDDALKDAVMCGQLKIVKYLVTAGANIPAIEDEDRREAKLYGHQDVLEYLTSLTQ